MRHSRRRSVDGSIAPFVAADHSAHTVPGSSDAYSGHGSPGR
jgi:hypothetical protein